jgi:hypothetical protein
MGTLVIEVKDNLGVRRVAAVARSVVRRNLAASALLRLPKAISIEPPLPGWKRRLAERRER